jgi:hypothetical protein
MRSFRQGSREDAAALPELIFGLKIFGTLECAALFRETHGITFWNKNHFN